MKKADFENKLINLLDLPNKLWYTSIVLSVSAEQLPRIDYQRHKVVDGKPVVENEQWGIETGRMVLLDSGWKEIE